MDNVKNSAESTQTYQIDTKMNMPSTIAYIIGSGGSNASFAMINTYLMLFYTDVVGLSAAAISLIMMIARVWDAVNDPMMGVIADRTNTRFGKFRPWLMVGPPFLAIFNILTFTAWPMQGAVKAVVCCICYIGAGMAYTIVGTAINGLVNRLTNNPEHKMKLIAWAQIGNQIVGAIMSAVMMPLILHFSKSDVANAAGYFKAAAVVSIVTCSLVFVAAWKCREVQTPEELNPDKKTKEKISLAKSLKSMAKNSQLVLAVSSVFFVSFGVMARMTLISYYSIYCLGSYEMISPLLTAMTIGSMVGNVPLPYLTSKFGKKKCYIVMECVVAALYVIWFFVPTSAPGMLFIAMSFVCGLFGSATSITYAFICDSIEYGDLKYNVRDEGLAFTTMSFMVKLGSAIVGSLGVILLSAIGYVAGAEQTASTLTGISAIVNLFPAAVIAIGALLIAFLYRLTDKKMADVTNELVKKRNGQDYEIIEVK